MHDRRRFIGHAARVAALLASLAAMPRLAAAAWDKSAFDAKTLSDALKALGAGAAPAESREVTLTGPDIAENGAVVPVGVATTLPNARKLLLVVEKNPNVLAAVFELNDAIEPSFATRVKMGQSSNVYAVAITADGRALFAVKEIKVTLGGCGG